MYYYVHTSYVGFPMFFNQGKFRQNGCCGYILKPKIMRDPNETGMNACLVSYLATVLSVSNLYCSL